MSRPGRLSRTASFQTDHGISPRQGAQESGASSGDQEIARLDAIIDDNDGGETVIARWRAAHAVYEKGVLVEGQSDYKGAIALYADVVRRLEGVRDYGPRELLICAMRDIAVLCRDYGDREESKRVARRLVEAHFDDAPPEAAEAVVGATLVLARMVSDEGQATAALRLYERVLQRDGQAGLSGGTFAAAAAKAESAWALRKLGQSDEAERRLASAIDELGDPDDDLLRRLLAESLARRAQVLDDQERYEERDLELRRLVERFRDSEDPAITGNVAWAEQILAKHRSLLGRSKRWFLADVPLKSWSRW